MYSTYILLHNALGTLHSTLYPRSTIRQFFSFASYDCTNQISPLEQLLRTPFPLFTTTTSCPRFQTTTNHLDGASSCYQHPAGTRSSSSPLHSRRRRRRPSWPHPDPDPNLFLSSTQPTISSRHHKMPMATLLAAGGSRAASRAKYEATQARRRWAHPLPT